MWKRKKRQVEKEKTEPDIRDIVPMVKIEPIVVPEPLERTRANLDILKNYLVNSAEDGLEASEILSNNA